jgi:transcriptional regulator with XRE-family HTH domain
MAFGDKLRNIRLKKGIAQESISEKLGYATQSYISEVENNKFIPKQDKLKVWAKALGMTWQEMEDLLLEAQLEELGMADPGFTLMFKDIPKMTAEEKRSILRAYEAVKKARQKRKVKE